MPKARDFTDRIIPLFVIVMIGWVLVISLLALMLGRAGGPRVGSPRFGSRHTIGGLDQTRHRQLRNVFNIGIGEATAAAHPQHRAEHVGGKYPGARARARAPRPSRFSIEDR